MYSFQIGSRAPAGQTHGRIDRTAVPRVVFWIGLSSLLADISAESVASALPVFLFSVLQLSPLEVGFLDGLYQGGAALVSVMAAYFADRRRNNRGIALLGYALSTISRLGLIASGSLGLLVAMVALCIDRVGKGIRTAPRDAIIAGHTLPSAMGAAFGVHRALDAVGAFVGPLVGAALLWLMPGHFEGLFWASFVFGVLGVLVFRARATEPCIAPTQPDAVLASPGLGAMLRLMLGNKPFVRLMLLAVFLAAFTISDGLVYLTMQREAGIDAKTMPLMFALTSAVFLLAAAPAGRLADRIGLVPLFLAGYAVLASLYLWIAFGPHQSLSAVIAVVALMGLHYAATDGVLAATAARTLNPQVRTSGLAVISTAVGLIRIGSSSLYGWMWQRIDQHAAVVAFALGMTGCCLTAFLVLTMVRRPVPLPAHE